MFVPGVLSVRGECSVSVRPLGLDPVLELGKLRTDPLVPAVQEYEARPVDCL